MTAEIIHLQWDGPFTYEKMTTFNGPTDFGIYQVCGLHPVYGASLLYVGRAQKRTFATRLQEEGWPFWEQVNGSVEFYLGRLSGSETPHNDTWNLLIARVEQLLIYAHHPARNATSIAKISDPDVATLHILNWGNRGKLLPEVSGYRWSHHFDAVPNYAPFGSHTSSELDTPLDS